MSHEGAWPSIVAITSEVHAETLRAMGKFPPFNSNHEGWAVIKEELDELWDEVKKADPHDPVAREEAIQVAAMAVRFVHDLCDADP